MWPNVFDTMALIHLAKFIGDHCIDHPSTSSPRRASSMGRLAWDGGVQVFCGVDAVHIVHTLLTGSANTQRG